LELALVARNGESLLLTLGIPVLLLVFFANVDVLPIDGEPIDFLAPGVLALAVLSTSLVNLAIATGFEREYGVLKRLGATPLGRPRLLAAKTVAILVVEAVQLLVLWAIALMLGWDPDPHATAALAVVLGTVACAGLGLCLAGSLKALVTLAAANGLYLVLLLLSGMVIPLAELPGPVRAVARALPSGALAEAVRGSLTTGVTVPGRAWVVLVAWAVAAPLLAVRLFRWE
jgi:ABC-2 type transport system permease protein